MMTPYEKLKSLADVKKHLKPGITIEQLNKIENSMTDNQAADRMNEAKKKLFKQIHESNKLSA